MCTEPNNTLSKSESSGLFSGLEVRWLLGSARSIGLENPHPFIFLLWRRVCVFLVMYTVFKQPDIQGYS